MSKDGKNPPSNFLKPARFGAGKAESGGAAAMLTPSKLAGNPFLSKPTAQEETESGSAALLRPSAFGTSGATASENTENSTPKKTELLKPATLHNPFSQVVDKAHANGHDSKPAQASGTEPSNYFSQFAATGTSDKTEEASSGGFVFGQNLGNRVAKADESAEAENSADEKTESSTPATDTADVSKSPVTGAPSDGESSNDASRSAGTAKHMTLKESAEAYQARHQKQTYDEVQVVTGEEEESNVLKASCCLYLFDKLLQTWTERGRGVLHLNDIPPESGGEMQSRLVMRLQGSMKVVLNAALWPDMMVDRAGDRSVRITAPDPDGEIRILLIKANLGQAEQIYLAIRTRVMQLRAAEARPASAPASEPGAASPSHSAVTLKRPAQQQQEDHSKKSRPDETSEDDRSKGSEDSSDKGTSDS